ncbi:MAG TPA: ParA family protein [Verrucomicrobiae bacterium]|nr:ParA family protein [Verrucomicrobiae bacterium]
MILAIANQKGGVGKTTTSINLAAALAQKGYETLLLDLDPQGNATLSFLDPEQIQTSIYEALTDEDKTVKDAVCKTAYKHLSVVPARINLAKFESKLLGDIDSHFRLKDRLKSVVKEFKYIIIDTPPTLGLMTVNSLVAASHLLVPIQSSYFALEGTDDLLETVEKIRARANPTLEFLGVVITIHDKRTILGRDIRNHINEVFGKKVFRTIISRSVRLEESPAYKEPIFTFAPHSTGALEYYKLSEEVIGRV